jgi:hypothetical protein
MKKVAFLSLLIFMLCTNLFATIVPSPVNTPVLKQQKKAVLTDAFSQMDAKTFLMLTPAKVKEVTGKKMNLGQKISLKLVQHQLKKQLRKGENPNMEELSKRAASGIDPLWLILGLLLGLIGVIIALITKKGPDDNRVRSSLIGWLIWIVIVVVAIAL